MNFYSHRKRIWQNFFTGFRILVLLDFAQSFKAVSYVSIERATCREISNIELFFHPKLDLDDDRERMKNRLNSEIPLTAMADYCRHRGIENTLD